MPVLSGLSQNLSRDPSWRRHYKSNIRVAWEIVRRMPLVHVTCKAELILSQDCSLKTTEVTGDTNTQNAETIFNLTPAVYFYAGRACASFGYVALAFMPEVENGHEGDMTPFDSGGMVDKIMSSMGNNLNLKRQFVQDSIVELHNWRKQFGRVLAAYFDNPDQYWTGRPCRNDPERIFDPQNGNIWKAWTSEIRFHDSIGIDHLDAWCARKAQTLKIQQLGETIPPSGRKGYREFLKRCINQDGSPRWCDELEEYVKVISLA